VAVGASDEALSDLGLKRFDPVAAGHQLRNRRLLLAHVVEHQDEEVIDPAIEAAARRQDSVDELPIAGTPAIEPAQSSAKIEMNAPEVSACRGATPMTVDADDFAIPKPWRRCFRRLNAFSGRMRMQRGQILRAPLSTGSAFWIGWDGPGGWSMSRTHRLAVERLTRSVSAILRSDHASLLSRFAFSRISSGYTNACSHRDQTEGGPLLSPWR
jgi:hypothetical protein